MFVAEVLIDGQVQELQSNGTFETLFYIPRTGKTIEIVAFDIKGHRNAPPGLRIWCGATIELKDLVNLTPWLNWAFEKVISKYR